MTRRLSPLFLLTLLVAAIPGTAHAYLDPGTGSYLLQLLIGSLLGGLYAVKLLWGRIRARLTSFSAKREG
jgi:hypothetical protein